MMSWTGVEVDIGDSECYEEHIQVYVAIPCFLRRKE